MAVSKHNLWKRKKNGIMKLVRSHSDWLQRRRDMKMKKLGNKRFGATNENKQWWENSSNNTSTPSNTKSVSSTKRTQVGKKI